jgi:hypothetical protein
MPKLTLQDLAHKRNARVGISMLPRIASAAAILCLLGFAAGCDPGANYPAQSAYACDPTNCAGCCEGNVCVTAPDVESCGFGGDSCGRCAMGQECSNGRCEAKSSCQATCDGCCTASGQCQPVPNDSSCGIGGGQCQVCSAGTTCAGGHCQVGQAEAEECANYECRTANGACVSGTLASVCGKFGASCGACDAGQACILGTCEIEQGTPPPYSDSDGGGEDDGANPPSDGSNDDASGGDNPAPSKVWDIIAVSASVASTSASGGAWDNAWLGNPKPDPFLIIRPTWAKWYYQGDNSAAISNTYQPVWNETIGSWNQEDLLDPTGIWVTVEDDDLLIANFNDVMGECVVVLTLQDLQSGEKKITTCGSKVSDVIIQFTQN